MFIFRELTANRMDIDERQAVKDFFERVLIDTFDKNDINDLKDLLREEIEEKKTLF